MQFDFEELSKKDRYKLLCAVVAPRPIALITSISPSGIGNAAPMSFFNVFGDEPPIIIVGVQNRLTGGPKDTAENARSTGEFVVNMVNREIGEAMITTAVEFPPEVDEVEKAGFTYEPSVKVRPSRIKQSPASMECRLERIVDYSNRSILFGEVVHMNIDDECIDPVNLHIDNQKYQPLGRLHGDYYVSTETQFQLHRPTYQEWLDENEPENPNENN